MLLLLIAFLLIVLLLGLLLLVGVGRQQRRLGILTGDRIAQDTQERPGKLLVATTVPLRGKPDYLIRRGNDLIPVEIKTTTRVPSQVSRNHLVQLYAYCLLVEETYGVIRYIDRATLAVLKEQRRAYPEGTAEHVRALVDEMVRKKQGGRAGAGLVSAGRMGRRCRADGRCTGSA